MVYVSIDNLRRYRMNEGDFKLHREPVVCADGFKMSVQASNFHYCTPCIDNAGWYTHYEVGYPSKCEELLVPYCDSYEREDDAGNVIHINYTQSVYACVPVEVIAEVVKKHGGLK